MLLLTNKHFNNELQLPQIPVYIEEIASYGSAKMMQSAAESDLLTFVDEKALEYLRLFFGDSLAEEIVSSWELDKNNKSTTEKNVYTIDNTTQRNVWISVNYEEYDLSYSDLSISTFEKTVKRYGNSSTITFTKNAQTVIMQYLSGKLQVLVSDNVEDCDITDVRNLFEPKKAIRGLLNVLLSYEGERPVSPIANYVYYKVNQNAANGTTSMGESDLNFSRASSSYEADKFLKSYAIRNKQIKAWNGMCDLNKKVSEYTFKNASDFSDYTIPFCNHRKYVTYINQFNI